MRQSNQEMHGQYSRSHFLHIHCGRQLSAPILPFCQVERSEAKGAETGGSRVGGGEVEAILLFGSVNYEAFLFYLISLFPQKTPQSLCQWF